MKEKKALHRERHADGVRIDALVDLIAICPRCGGELGLWSDDDKEAVCIFCDHKVFEHEGTVH